MATSAISMKGYVINLDHRTDRKELMINQLAKYWPELDYEFLSGVVIKDQGFRKPNQAGCRSAHLQVMDKFLREDKENVLVIMEDDLKFFQEIKDPFKNIPQDWDMLYGTCRLKNVIPYEHYGKVLKSISQACYLLKRSFVPLYMKKVKNSLQNTRTNTFYTNEESEKYGNEHLINMRGNLTDFMVNHNIYVTYPLLCTINGEDDIGYSDINQKYTSEKKMKSYINRIHWKK